MRIHSIRFAIALALAVPLALTPVLAKDYGDIDKINSGINVDADSTAGTLETVNGGITVGERSRVRSAETVNGGIRLGDGAQADELETVNGGITIDAGAVVRDGASTVNGGIRLESAANVGGRVETVNGGITLDRAHIGGGIETVNGDIEVGAGSRVEGGIAVRKPTGWSWGKQRTPRVTIGAGAVVEGTLLFEREVELYVHDSATVGRIEGATAKRFSGDSLPEVEK